MYMLSGQCVVSTSPHSHEHTTLLQLQKIAPVTSINDNLARLNTYGRLTGLTHSEVAAKINKHMSSHPSVSNVVPCSDLDVTGVALLASKFHALIDQSLSSSFAEDDGRQIYLNPTKNHDRDGFEPSSYRDALCAETVKMWSHHIRSSLKVSGMDFTLPSLPDINNSALQRDGLLEGKTLSCAAGHTSTFYTEEDLGREESNGTDFPYWPRNTHFTGKGFGPYPFWEFGPHGVTDAWTLNISYFNSGYYGGTDLEVWQSTKLRANKFFHGKCYWELIFYRDLGTQSCAALHTENRWVVYTVDPQTKESDGKFCCDMQVGTKSPTLQSLNRKFVDNMKYYGEVDFHGHYYEGRAKQYIMSLYEAVLPLNVFYETTLDGIPLRIGEVDPNYIDDGILSEGEPPFVFEEMDPNSVLRSEPFPDSTFDVPEVCEGTPNFCGFLKKGFGHYGVS